MLVGWIRTSIDPKIRSTVTFVPDAHKLWETLQRRFSVRNGVQIHQHRDAIGSCQQNGQTVIDYYGRLTKLWEELDNLKTTRSCTCEASTDIEKEREEIRVHKFLFGLDESLFRNIRSQIIDEDPLPDLNNVYSRVVREEQHNNKARTTELKTEAVGFSVQNIPPKQDTSQAAATISSRSRDPNRFCTHCSRKGHESSECFLLHGYPHWWYEQQKSTASHGSGQRGRGGRFSTGSCGRGRTNFTRAVTNNTTASTLISDDQISQIIQLLQSTQQRSNISTGKLAGKPKFLDVIIDTCASHHMSGNLSLLSDVTDILPSSIKFPDGRYSKAQKRALLCLVEIIT